MRTKSEVYHDRIAREYDRTYQTPYWRLYHEVTWHNIERFLPEVSDSLVLDAGGGTGYWAIRLAKIGYRVVLADISQGMLDVAQKKIERQGLQDIIGLKKLDVRDMRVIGSSLFDLVLAEGDLISYCEDEEKAVRELVRVTKPSGYVIASVDNKFAGLSRFFEKAKLDDIERFLEDGRFEWEFPIREFAPDELKELFESNGLEVVRVIGKTVLPYKSNPRILKSTEDFQRLLQLELRFCQEPALLGGAGHLEIVGKKEERR